MLKNYKNKMMDEYKDKVFIKSYRNKKIDIEKIFVETFLEKMNEALDKKIIEGSEDEKENLNTIGFFHPKKFFPKFLKKKKN